MLRAYQSCISGSGSTPLGRTCYHARDARGANILSIMFDMLDERTLRATMFAMLDKRARRTTSIFLVYRN